VSIDLRVATGATGKIGVAQSGYRVWRDTFGIHFIKSRLAHFALDKLSCSGYFAL